MKRLLKVSGYTFGVLLLLVALDMFGILGLSYPKAVYNNPLINPVRVLCITNNVMQMADGKCFDVCDGQAWKQRLDEEFGYELDVEQFDSENYMFYGKQKRFICGWQWARMIEIPLIPCKINLFVRSKVGIATEIKGKQPTNSDRRPL